MKIRFFVNALFLTLALQLLPVPLRAADATPTTNAPSPSVAKDSRCFELRTYYAAEGKIEALSARFRESTLPLFKKHGMEVVAFWIVTEKKAGEADRLVYVLAHKSRDESRKTWSAFISDPEWRKVTAETEANGKLTTKVDSVFMAATDYSPIK